MSEHIHYVTDDTFEAEVLQAQQPVLVDYWAEWCGPCKMIAPILDEIANEYAGNSRSPRSTSMTTRPPRPSSASVASRP